MIRRPPRSTLDRSSAASDVYKRQTMTSNQLLGDSYKSLALDVSPAELADLIWGNNPSPYAQNLLRQIAQAQPCLLYTSPSPRDRTRYRMPSSA